MIAAVRYAFLALPLGLCFAGCSTNDRADSRYNPVSAPRTSPGQGHGFGGSAAYAAPSAPRYDISLDEIREHARNQTALFLDVRGPGDFAEGHVRGAFNMPASQREALIGKLSQRASRDDLIIIYCSSVRCASGDMVYEYLASQGFTNMRVFRPGWEALSSARDLR